MIKEADGGSDDEETTARLADGAGGHDGDGRFLRHCAELLRPICQTCIGNDGIFPAGLCHESDDRIRVLHAVLVVLR